MQNLNIPEGQLVQVYKNLNREKQNLPDCWSVKTKVDGKWKVIGYVSEITLEVTLFKVREGGRQKVLEVKQKNVHAWIEGYIKPTNNSLSQHITYVPYAEPHFFCVSTKQKLTTENTTLVTFRDKRVYR